MKRILYYGVIVLSLSFNASLYSFKYTVNNNTDYKMYAILDTISWPNYEHEIEARKSWEFSTIACSRRIIVRGQEGAIKGLYQEAEIPGSGCGNRTIDVSAHDFYTDPVTGQERARYLEIDVI